MEKSIINITISKVLDLPWPDRFHATIRFWVLGLDLGLNPKP